MPDEPISQLTLQTDLADTDLGVGVDVSDTTQSGNGTTKKWTWTLVKSFLKTYFDGIYANLSGSTLTSTTLTSPTLTSPVINTGVSGTAIDTDVTLSSNSTTKLPSQSAVYGAVGLGWLGSEAATFVSADGSTGVFNIASDVTGKYSPGMRYKYTQDQALSYYWTFNTNSTADVGSATMANIGTPTYTAGKFSNALTLNGTDQALSITDAAGFKPTGEFTIGCWFKKTGAGTEKVIFQSYSANTSLAGVLLEVHSTNHIRVVIGKNTGITQGTDYFLFEGSTNVADNTYHYCVVSFRNNYCQIYIDGKLEVASYCPPPAYAATNYVRIGCTNSAGSNSLFFDGQIDDLFLINGYALDEKTIAAKYAAATAQGTGNITVQKYGLITAVGTYSGGNTPITIWGGTDYSTANATISSPYYSTVSQPFGFNRNPDKWTVTVSNDTLQTQSTPSAGTVYNTGSISIVIPVGIWKLGYQGSVGAASTTSGTNANCSMTLSTANNTQSDFEFTSFVQPSITATLTAFSFFGHVEKSKIISLTAKTTYYCNIFSPNANVTAIYMTNANEKLFIRAVSTLL